MAGIAGGFNPTFNPRFATERGDGFKLELKGLADLTRKLDRRIVRLQQSVLRQACQAFAEPIRADAERRARALVSPRVQIKTEIRIRGDSANVKIGPVGEFFYLFFFEYGYHIRATRKGPSIHFVPPRPTMRPAYDAHREEGLRAMEKILFDALGEEVGTA
jgi:hypothetical protein